MDSESIRKILGHVLLTILLVEIGASLILLWRDRKGISTGNRRYLSVPDVNLGWTPPHNSVYPVWSELKSAEMPNQITYRTDRWGRRILSPEINVSLGETGRNQSFLLFGCSFVFSNGLPDNETLQFYLSKELPNLELVNYGVHGYGPQQLLRVLEIRDLKNEVTKPIAGGAYFFMIDHFIRSMNSSNNLYTTAGPWYEVHNGELQYLGTFKQAHPWQYLTRRLADFSGALQLAGVHIPLRITKADIERVALMLIKARTLFREKLGSELLIVIHPLYAQNRQSEIELLLNFLHKARVEVWTSATPITDSSKYIIPNDGHPNGEMNRVLSTELAAAIREL